MGDQTMFSLYKTGLAALGLAASDLVMPAAAGDLVAGRVKAGAKCSNCHGLDGMAPMAGAAKLGGQKKEYLRERLRNFRSGSRQNPQMTFIAKPLADADIDDLSEWYSAIKVAVEIPK